MNGKDLRIVKRIALAIMFFAILPTVTVACPDGNYSSIVEWWDKGNAQLTTACNLDPLSAFWGDDFISALFSNYSRWVAGYIVSIWNDIVMTWYGKLVLIVIPAILAALIYDLLKTLVKKI